MRAVSFDSINVFCDLPRHCVIYNIVRFIPFGQSLPESQLRWESCTLVFAGGKTFDKLLMSVFLFSSYVSVIFMNVIMLSVVCSN